MRVTGGRLRVTPNFEVIDYKIVLFVKFARIIRRRHDGLTYMFSSNLMGVFCECLINGIDGLATGESTLAFAPTTRVGSPRAIRVSSCGNLTHTNNSQTEFPERGRTGHPARCNCDRSTRQKLQIMPELTRKLISLSHLLPINTVIYIRIVQVQISTAKERMSPFSHRFSMLSIPILAFFAKYLAQRMD